MNKRQPGSIIIVVAAAIGLAAAAPAAFAQPKDTVVFDNKVSQKDFNGRCSNMGGSLSTSGHSGDASSTCDFGGGSSATCAWDSSGSVCIGTHGGGSGGGGRPQ